jgi:hypothetical protein
MKKSIIYISSLLLASCAHASLPPPRSYTYTLRQSNPWSPAEDARLRQLVQQHGTENWDVIARQLLGRTRYQCREHWDSLNPDIVKGNWTLAEDETIRRWVRENGPENWDALAPQLPGRTGKQCKNRWNNNLNPSLVKGDWAREEDDIITEWVQQYGEKYWAALARQLPGRIGMQCRDRWMNHLNPEVNQNPWTPEEDTILIRLHALYGNKWRIIASMMRGRTDNQVKNRWNTVLKKRFTPLKTQFRSTSSIPFSLPAYVPLVQLPTYEPPAQLPTYGSREPWLPPLLKGPCNPTGEEQPPQQGQSPGGRDPANPYGFDCRRTFIH